jgi:hypothetical protein
MSMKLLTSHIRERLLRNGRVQRQCTEQGEAEPDFLPVVKLFTPDGGCTWLLTERDPDDPDIAFGLCDLGAGVRARQAWHSGRAGPSFHGYEDAVRLRRRGVDARRDQSVRRAMSTNITAEHRAAFEALTSGRFENFALFSCFVDGEPAAAIVAVNRDGEDYTISPLFVALTPAMVVTDHDGQPCEPLQQGRSP